MEIILVNEGIGRTTLMEMAEEQFGDMVKAVVDIDKRVMAVGGGLHVDEESFLLELGSVQNDADAREKVIAVVKDLVK